MRYFDANCRLGRYNRWSGREPITPEALLPVMDHVGVHEALVVDNLSREHHPLDGNERVLELTAGHPRLHPAWVGLPPRSGELPAPTEFVDEMAERGVRALFLFPRQYYFPLTDWCVDDLLGPLAERRVPLFICPNTATDTGVDQTDWSDVVRLCRAFPDLPVIVDEFRIEKNLRPVYQALDACAELRLDVSSLWHHRMIEFICREWGAHRLLFGSGLPVRDPSAVLGQLNYAEIPPGDLAAVAGGNLRTLLSWNPHAPLPTPAVDFPAPVDELHAMARNRDPLVGQGFLCAHGHLGRTPRLHIPDGSVPDLLAELSRLGIERCIVFGNGGLSADETYDNDAVADVARAHPETFIGFVTTNLNRSNDGIRHEIERGFAMGMKGIKVHPAFSGCASRSTGMEIACACAHERGACIVNHDWGDAEWLRHLCRKYPEACFITGHSCGETIPVAREVDNLYVGTCPLNDFGGTERLVERAGVDRILFGSDLCWDPIAWGLGPILYAAIPIDTKRAMLGRNLRRVLTEYGVLGTGTPNALDSSLCQKEQEDQGRFCV